MKILLTALMVALTGCSGLARDLENTLGVQADDNAVLTVCAELESANPFVDSTVQIRRLEFPDGFNSSLLTLDQINDLLGCR